MEACTLEVENGKNEIIEILNSRANVKGKAQRFDAMMEQAEIRKAEISQRILRLKSEEEEQQTILTTARKQYDEITSQIENANEECEHLNLSVMKIQEKLKDRAQSWSRTDSLSQRGIPAGFSQKYRGAL